ncbi:TPA: hypothetical protein N0F65_012819 [Lagenidium giganteum]|uniref:Uncharacterized protein n=1 Tax=Lagenidium giganteum TaxID=4803 RepID=A0AAV2YII2_9STRA|nr:TPA: hypothetical protein N0F65_012819 [Lagenidium giganteum]
MAGAKIADILHKTATTGLVVLTVAGLADVTRGFSVLVKRNIDRREAAAANHPVGDASSEQNQH